MSVGVVTLCGMESELPSTLRYLAQRQNGVVSRSQALRAGLTTDKIKFRLRSGRWRLMHRGVYATFTGAPGRGAWLWAAVLSAGPGAALSYETAAELHRLTDKPAETIHVTVPHDRRVRAVEGVSLHRSARAVQAVQADTYPPRTTVEETVLDLTQAAGASMTCAAGSPARSRGISPTRTGCVQAMTVRPRLRWRADLHELIVPPRAVTIRCWSSATTATWSGRMACRSRAGRCRSPDRAAGEDSGTACTTEYGVVVELDGRLAHPAENQWKDKARDNAAAADGKQSLRYGWVEVTRKACATAVEVARVLRLHGWDGRPRPCSPGCPVQPEPQPQPKPKLQPKPERQPKLQPKPERQPKLQPKPERQPKLQPKPERQPKLQPKPERQPKLLKAPSSARVGPASHGGEHPGGVGQVGQDYVCPGQVRRGVAAGRDGHHAGLGG